MAFGDRLFGINGACGTIQGTGTDIFIPLDCFPQWVEVFNTTSGAALFWNKDMPQDSGYLFAGGGGGGGVTGATSGGTPAGTVTAPVFTGTEGIITGNSNSSAVTGTAAAQTFSGSALGTHTHSLVSQNDTGTFAAWRIYVGPVGGGPFTVGETVTGGTSAGTAVVAAQGTNASGQIYLDLSAIGGVGANLVYNEVLTGGTSGATATSRSVLVGRVTPSATVHNLEAVSVSANGITPLDADFGMTVCPPNTRLRLSFLATYITLENAFEIGADDPDGAADLAAYNVFYETPATTAVSAGTPAGTNGTSAVTGTAAAQVLTINNFTPAGVNSIPVFSGAPLATHTHTYAGGGGGGFITVGGISAGTSGFIIGANTSLNILGDTLNWNIGRF